MSLQKLTALIQKSNHIILSTHRQCDGDGLGAELGLYHALKKVGKNVKVINVDSTPSKYNFLKPKTHIQIFEDHPVIPENIDLALIFDTNDHRLVEPLYSELSKKSKSIAFIDHHPILKKGPAPTPDSLIDQSAASTGELAFRMIEDLGIPLDVEISRALYTSLVFDTQLFRYVRNSPTSHLMAAKLLELPIESLEIHRSLFGHQTPQKLAFLSRALQQIEYHCDGKLAVIRIRKQDLLDHSLDLDDSRDLIDFVMNIEALEAAALFREDGHNLYKLSLRGKGHCQVLPLAESLGGGGHPAAAGASLGGEYSYLKEIVVREMTKILRDL